MTKWKLSDGEKGGRGACDFRDSEWGKRYGLRDFNGHAAVQSLKYIKSWAMSGGGRDLPLEDRRALRRDASWGCATLRGMAFNGIPPQTDYVHVNPEDIFGGASAKAHRDALQSMTEDEFEDWMAKNRYGIFGWVPEWTEIVWHYLQIWAKEVAYDLAQHTRKQGGGMHVEEIRPDVPRYEPPTRPEMFEDGEQTGPEFWD